MEINEKTVAIDTDFINHIVETKSTIEEIENILKELFSYLQMNPIIHPLVYENEIDIKNKKIKHLFDNNIIVKVEFSEFINEEAGKIYYIYLVREFFNVLLGESLEFTDEEIFSKWIRKKSLGEIHSISMCIMCNSNIFLSDDNDSKQLKNYIEQKGIGKITVYNRSELMEEYKSAGGTAIPRTQRRHLTHENCT